MIVRILLEEWQHHLVGPVDLHLDLVHQSLIYACVEDDVGALQDVEVLDRLLLVLQFRERLLPALHDGVVEVEELIVVYRFVDDHLVVLLEGVDEALLANVTPDYPGGQRNIPREIFMDREVHRDPFHHVRCLKAHIKD